MSPSKARLLASTVIWSIRNLLLSLKGGGSIDGYRCFLDCYDISHCDAFRYFLFRLLVWGKKHKDRPAQA